MTKDYSDVGNGDSKRTTKTIETFGGKKVNYCLARSPLPAPKIVTQTYMAPPPIAPPTTTTTTTTKGGGKKTVHNHHRHHHGKDRTFMEVRPAAN